MNVPIRAAIIGGGMIADVHQRAIRAAGGTVIGVLGSSPERSTATAAMWGVPQGYADLETLLSDAPDVVHVCTPNNMHVEYALAVIHAGIHVVCEKPLAPTYGQAVLLADAADTAGIVATVPFVYRYHPLVREIRARRIAGEFGRTLLLHGSYLQDWLVDPLTSSWRVDASANGASRAFADIGSHWCDLAMFVSGEEFVELCATTTVAYTERPTPAGASFGSTRDESTGRITVTTEDTAMVLLRAASGVTASTVVSQVSAGRKNRLWLELDGSRHSAAFDQENPESFWLGGEQGSMTLHRGEGSVSGAQQRLNLVPAGHAQGYTDAFAAFVTDTYAAIRGYAPEGLPTFRDGAASSAIVDAVLASATTETWQSIAQLPSEGDPA